MREGVFWGFHLLSSSYVTYEGSQCLPYFIRLIIPTAESNRAKYFNLPQHEGRSLLKFISMKSTFVAPAVIVHLPQEEPDKAPSYHAEMLFKMWLHLHRRRRCWPSTYNANSPYLNRCFPLLLSHSLYSFHFLHSIFFSFFFYQTAFLLKQVALYLLINYTSTCYLRFHNHKLYFITSNENLRFICSFCKIEDYFLLLSLKTNPIYIYINID